MRVVRKLTAEDGRSVYSVIHKAAGQGVLPVGMTSETVSSGGSKGASRDASPPWSKFFQFHAVFGQIWQNHMLAPPGSWSPPRGNSRSATGSCRQLQFMPYWSLRNCTRQNHGTAGNREAGGFVNSVVSCKYLLYT